MTTSFQAFALKCATAPAVLAKAQREAVRAAALAVTTTTRTELSRATKGSNRLSGVGLKGAKLGVGFDVKGTANGGTALVKARGPWQLIEGDTAAHTIAPRKRRRKVAVVTPAGPRASVQHPGTRGKHPWSKGVSAGAPVAAAAAVVEGQKGILKVVRG